MKTTVYLLSFILVVIGIYSFQLGNNYAELQDELEIIEVKKEELKAETKHALEIERIKGYARSLPEEYKQAGYDAWMNAKYVAEYLYEESEGRFRQDWGTFMALEAERRGIDPLIVYELLKVETGGTFDPEAVGPETKYGHAYGMAQFMENTGPWIADMAGLHYEHEMLFDPYYSIQLSVVYLDFLYDQFGDWDHALTAYHRGIYGMKEYIEKNGNAKSWYAVEIQENAKDNSLVVTGSGS